MTAPDYKNWNVKTCLNLCADAICESALHTCLAVGIQLYWCIYGVVFQCQLHTCLVMTMFKCCELQQHALQTCRVYKLRAKDVFF